MVKYIVEITSMEIKLTDIEQCVKTTPNIAVKETQVCNGSSDLIQNCTVWLGSMNTSYTSLFKNKYPLINKYTKPP